MWYIQVHHTYGDEAGAPARQALTTILRPDPGPGPRSEARSSIIARLKTIGRVRENNTSDSDGAGWSLCNNVKAIAQPVQLNGGSGTAKSSQGFASSELRDK
jgi:hypothetical protein